jgi:hypothetical protein
MDPALIHSLTHSEEGEEGQEGECTRGGRGGRGGRRGREVPLDGMGSQHMHEIRVGSRVFTKLAVKFQARKKKVTKVKIKCSKGGVYLA